VPRPPLLRRLATAVLVTGALLACGGGPALAEVAPRPTADPSAPTPTAPWPGLPPQGSAPDGSTVGGRGLDTRGLVTVAGAPPPPEGIDAKGWLVADALTGQVLGARDPHGRYLPASTLKTLTLLTLAPVLDVGAVVEGTTEDEAMEGSRVGLVRGGRYPVDLLFRALVMQSGNDAANALARAAGGIEPTLAAMNATAAGLGAFDTVAGTPSGLDVAGQSSSPYDLALIMRRLVADPYTLGVLQTRTAIIPGVEGLATAYEIQNQDTLLRSYPGTLGGKSGFTDAARHTFVAAAERDGRRLLVSIMQAERRPVPELEQATRLLDWGFAVPRGAAGLGRLVEPGEVPTTVPPSPSSPTAAPDQSPAATPSAAGVQAAAEADSPVLPVALAVGAVLIVAATVAGRLRARHPVPARAHRGDVSRPAAAARRQAPTDVVGRAPGSPLRPSAPRRPPGRAPGGPATDPPSAPGPPRPPAAG
jgi:D-alanyl-D-alanine carboxypeptidase (penicillin-binding protein 5/6)